MVNNDLVKRHSELIEKIGFDRLMALPEEVQDLLKMAGSTSLELKVRMLEEIAKAL